VAKVKTFVLATLLISWSFIGLFALLGGEWSGLSSVVFGVIYMFIPAGVAMFLERRAGGSLKALAGFPVKLSRWYLVAWLLPIAVALASIGVALLLPGVRWDPEMSGMFTRFADSMSPEELAAMQQQLDALPIHPLFIGLGQALVAAVTVNAIAAWGEEVGWRGYMLRALAPLGFWRSSLLIGVIWGVWHAPIIVMGHNYPEHPFIGVGMMIVFCVLMSPLIQHVTQRAGSVLVAAVFHGAINASAGLAIMVVSGGSDLIVGVTGAAGFIVLGSANALLWVATSRRASSSLPRV